MAAITNLLQRGADRVKEADYREACMEYQDELKRLAKLHAGNPNHQDFADVHEKLGSMYMILGEYMDGLQSYRQAMQIRHTNCSNPYDPFIGKCHEGMGVIHQRVGDFNDAHLCFKIALEIYIDAYQVERYHSSIANLYVIIAELHIETGHYSEGLTSLNEAFEEFKNLLGGGENYSVCEAHTRAGNVYAAMCKYDAAFEHYQNAAAVISKYTSDKAKFTIASTNADIAMTNLHIECGNYEAADMCINQAMECCQQTFSGNFDNIHSAAAKKTYGYLQQKTGDLNGALKTYELVLKMLLISFGSQSQHPQIANIFDSIGTVNCELGKYKIAHEYHQKASAIRQVAYVGVGAKHPHLANGLVCEGDVFLKQGMYQKALECYSSALKLRKDIFSSDQACHSSIAQSHSQIGDIHTLIGESKLAEYHYTESLCISMNVFKLTTDEEVVHTATAATLCKLANLCSSICDLEQSLSYQQQAQVMYERLLWQAPELLDYSNLYICQAKMAEAQIRHREALIYYGKAFERKSRHFVDPHPEVFMAKSFVANAKIKIGDFDYAVEDQFAAISGFSVIYGKGAKHPNVAFSYEGIGNAYLGKRDFISAVEYHTKAVSVYKDAYGRVDDPTTEVKHVDVARSYTNIGSIYCAEGIHYATASQYLTQSLDMYNLLFKSQPDHSYIAKCHYSLGCLHLKMKNYEAALEVLEKSLTTTKELICERMAMTDALSKIGDVLCEQGQHQDALTHYKEALAIREAAPEEYRENIDMVAELYNVANVHMMTESREEAYGYYVRALNMLLSLSEFAVTNDEMEARMYHNLADVRSELNHEQVEIMELYADAMAVYEKISPTHEQLAVIYEKLSVLNFSFCRYEKSLEIDLKWLEHRKHWISNKSSSMEICKVYESLGATYYTLGKCDKAVEQYQVALEIKNNFYSEEDKTNYDIARSHCMIGTALERSGNPQMSIKHHNETLTMLRSMNNENSDHPNLGNVYYNIGLALANQGEFEKAQEYLADAFKNLSEIYPTKFLSEAGEGWLDVAVCMRCLGWLNYRVKEYDAAIMWFKDAITVVQLNARKHPELALNLFLCGHTLLAQVMPQEALNHLEDALCIWKLLFNNHPDIARCHHQIGTAYKLMKYYDEATAHYNLSYLMKINLLGKDHRSCIVYHEEMANLLQKMNLTSQAVEHFLKALEIKKNWYWSNPDNSDIAGTLEDLREAYDVLGDKLKSESFNQLARDMRSKTEIVSDVGPGTPDQYCLMM